MKRTKRLYILLGVLAVVCIATLALTLTQRHTEKIRSSDEIVLTVPGDTVTKLAWTAGDETLSFHKGETWLYDEDDEFPVDAQKIEELLAPFASFGVSFVIEDVEDYAQYGLTRPVLTIDIGTADADYEIQLGDFSTMDNKRYVSIGDGNVYMVNEDPMNAFNIELSDMLDDDEIPDFDTVSEIRFGGATPYTVTYEAESPAARSTEDLYFTQQGGKTVALDGEAVESYLDAVSGLTLDEYVTYKAAAKDLKDCGLDAPDLTLDVTYTPADDEEAAAGPATSTLSISRDPAEKAKAEKAQGGEDEASNDTSEEAEDPADITAYARVGESPIVYKISGESYQKLMACSYDDLRYREMLSVPFADVTAVTASLEGETHTFETDGAAEADGEDDRTWRYGDEEIDIVDLRTAITALSASGADSFTEARPSGQEEIRLGIRYAGPAAQDGAQGEIEIALYRYDADACLAVVDGAPTAFIPRSQVVDLIEAVHALTLG